MPEGPLERCDGRCRGLTESGRPKRFQDRRGNSCRASKIASPVKSAKIGFWLIAQASSSSGRELDRGLAGHCLATSAQDRVGRPRNPAWGSPPFGARCNSARGTIVRPSVTFTSIGAGRLANRKCPIHGIWSPCSVAFSGILGNEGGTGRRLLRLPSDNCVPPQRGEAVEGPDRASSARYPGSLETAHIQAGSAEFWRLHVTDTLTAATVAPQRDGGPRHSSVLRHSPPSVRLGRA